MNKKVIKIGIMPQKEIRERTLAIARGEYKPKSDKPKIWFTSARSLKNNIQAAFGLHKAKHGVSLEDMEQAIRRRGT